MKTDHNKSLTVNDDLITRHLIEHVYPALQTQIGPSSSMEESLRPMLLSVAHRMAEARGLDAGLLPDADPQALAYLQGIDFSNVDVSILGDTYTALLSRRRQRGCYYTPRSLAESVARQALPRDTPIQRILDPAVGSGHFLLAAAGVIASRDTRRDRPQARWSALTICMGSTTTRLPLSGPLSAYGCGPPVLVQILRCFRAA
jgi:hypothetical protein